MKIEEVGVMPKRMDSVSLGDDVLNAISNVETHKKIVKLSEVGETNNKVLAYRVKLDKHLKEHNPNVRVAKRNMDLYLHPV